jgi:hypothetical protein
VLERWVASLLDKLERQRMVSARLRNDAYTDILTGLANRRAFDGALASLLRGQREHEALFPLLMLDWISSKPATTISLISPAIRCCVSPVIGFALRCVRRIWPHAMVARNSCFFCRTPTRLRPTRWPWDPAGVLRLCMAAARGHRKYRRGAGRSGDAATDMITRADGALYDAKHARRDRAASSRTVVSCRRPPVGVRVRRTAMHQHTACAVADEAAMK